MTPFEVLAYKCGLRDAIVIVITAIKQKNVETTAELLPALEESLEDMNEEVVETMKKENAKRVLN